MGFNKKFFTTGGIVASTPSVVVGGRIPACSGAKWVTANGDGSIGYTTSESLSGTWSKTSMFTSEASCVLWNGTAWVVGGAGTYTLAYSSNGTSWTGINLSGQNGVTIGYNGTYWFLGTNSSAWYTTDATASSGWTQVTNGISCGMSNGGSNVIWDGTNWVIGAAPNLYKVAGVNPNGTKTTLLSNVWSVVDWGGPNGKYVISERGGSQYVRTMDDSDGTNMTNVVTSWGLGIMAAATPNGAYAVDCCGFNFAYSPDYTNWTKIGGNGSYSNVGQGQYNGTVYGAQSGASTDSIYIQGNDSIGVNLTSASITNTGMGTGTNIQYIGSDNDRNRFYPYVDL